MWFSCINLMALVTGYGLSTAIGLPERDRRAITFEMGIQNPVWA